jgi:hypothetical protein
MNGHKKVLARKLNLGPTLGLVIGLAWVGETLPVPIAAGDTHPAEVYTVAGPAEGEVGREVAFTVTVEPGVLKAPVRLKLSTSGGDGSFNPASLELSDAARSGSFTYTPRHWGKRTIAVSEEGGPAEPSGTLAFVAKVQLGSTGTAPSGDRDIDLGGFNFFRKGAWWQELGRSIDEDQVAPDSDDLLAPFVSKDVHLYTCLWATDARGGNTLYGKAYNVVSGHRAMRQLKITKYVAQSDPGPAPFFPGMSIQAWYDPAGLPPRPEQIKVENHAIVLRRNEKTGGIDRLYEYYNAASLDRGKTWVSAGGAQWDLRTGAARPEGWTSSDAAGLPIVPLLVRYEEAATGQIDHPLRLIVPNWASRNRMVWPARHAVNTGSETTGLPMGARLRLKEEWYAANRAQFSPLNRAIVDAMRRYGVIVADLDTRPIFQIDGVTDERWDVNDLRKLRVIPVSAFEVVDTIHSPLDLTGPSSGAVGVPQLFAVRHIDRRDADFSTNVWLDYSTDGGNTWSRAQGWVTINDSHRGPLSLKFNPPTPGTYLLKAKPTQLLWVESPALKFRAVGSRQRRAGR